MRENESGKCRRHQRMTKSENEQQTEGCRVREKINRNFHESFGSPRVESFSLVVVDWIGSRWTFRGVRLFGGFVCLETSVLDFLDIACG